MSPLNWFWLFVFLDDDGEDNRNSKNKGPRYPIIRRFAAFFIDIKIVFLMDYFMPFSKDFMKYSVYFEIIIGVLIVSLLESSNFRASPGKMIMGLVTVAKDGGRLSLKGALVRNVVKWLPLFLPVIVFRGVYFMEYLLAIWVLINVFTTWLYWYALHDKLVKTYVACRPKYFELRHDPDMLIHLDK
ncbi:MAG: RDD family protein [Candidatus Pacearchaeota archaeon]|nr:RDD family protein [Candidatus Pacearchaeota archaeon]